MKILIIPFVLFLASCFKKEEIKLTTNCVEMKQNPIFKTEDLNLDYTIQFPSDYRGDGLMIDESVNFLKRSDNVVIKYNFLCPTNCIKFYGEPLHQPIPNSVLGSTIDATTIFDQRVEFCKNDIIETIFYHNSDDLSFGTLYLKSEDHYLSNATIQFKKEKFDEVISILTTLQKK